MTKRRIAILISLALAAPAAVVALEQAASTGETAEVAQPAQQAQTEPATAPEQVAVTEQQSEPVAQAEPKGPIGRILGAFQSATPSDAFPEGSLYSEHQWKALPNQAQYFAGLEQQRATMIARHDSFPMGSATGEELHQPLASQVAYFDRREQPMIASSQPQPVAAPEQSAQAGSAEVAMADTSAIR